MENCSSTLFQILLHLSLENTVPARIVEFGRTNRPGRIIVSTPIAQLYRNSTIIHKKLSSNFTVKSYNHVTSHYSMPNKTTCNVCIEYVIKNRYHVPKKRRI